MNTENQSSPKSWKTYLSIISMVILGILGLYYYNKYQNQLNQNQLEFAKELKNREDRISLLEKMIVSKNTQLENFKPYTAIVKSAALRDSIYKLLPYKFGESVFIMPDSTKAVINSISINGNATDYSIKYVVRTKKGNLETVSITDLSK